MNYGAQRNESSQNVEEMLEENKKMASSDLALGMVFFSQTVTGLLGNIFLLCHHLFLYHTDSRLKPTDLILTHLFIANILVIVSRGLPQTMEASGLGHFFYDLCCNGLLYIYRVSRGVSIFTICVLSVFQNVVVSPVNSVWKGLKVKVPNYIGFFIGLYWILAMTVNLFFPLYPLHVSGKGPNRNITRKINKGLCSTKGYGKVTASVYTALVVFPEVCFSLLMIWASGSMVIMLYTHKQQTRHIHSSKVLPRSPESRATHSILLLVSTFVSFYTACDGIQILCIQGTVGVTRISFCSYAHKLQASEIQNKHVVHIERRDT
ncbi:vomeronasal type-1 receptor 4-like [Ctenodactylus gundi]